MSTSSVSPSLANFSPKSFWKKPEGKPGMVLMAAIAGLGAWGLYLALPFLITLVTNMIELSILVGVLVGMFLLVMNGTVQSLAKNIFQSICRGIAMVYTEIDPIGILKNNLDDMRKAKAELDLTIQRFSGSDNKLVTKINDKNGEITTLMAQANQARKMAATTSDPDKAETLKLKAETFEQKAGMLMDGVKQLQTLELQTKDMLDKFRHWSRVSDAKIDRTAAKVEFYADQRAMILDAHKTLNIGMKLLRGNPEDLKLVDGAIEFLADDAARTVGEIQEFNRLSDSMLTDLDIEGSANAEKARAKFASFGQKLEEDAAKPSAVQQLEAALSGASAPITMPTGTVLGRGIGAGSTPGSQGSGDYNELFKS
jgi:hypothetical protein